MKREEIITVVNELTMTIEKVHSKADLIDTVCLLLLVKRDLLLSKRKERRLVTARKLIALYSIIYAKKGVQEIGEMLNRDHSSVTYLIKTAFEQTSNGTAPEIKELFHELKKRMS